MAEFVHWRAWSRDGDDWVLFATPFNRNYIDDLKGLIPVGLRLWAPELRSWAVHGTHMQRAADLVGVYFTEEKLCPVCFISKQRMPYIPVFSRLQGGNPARCLNWQDFESKAALYEVNEDVRQREYRRAHPREGKKAYGQRVAFGTSTEQEPGTSESESTGPRYKRVMDLD